MLQEIEHGVPLKHVDKAEVHDASAPKIEDVVLHTSSRPELLSEIRAAGGHHAVVSELKHTFLHEAHEGGFPLNHVAQVADKSAPAIADAHVGQWDKGAFLAEVQGPHWLNTVEPGAVHDRSAPHVQGDAGVGVARGASPTHGALLKEVAGSAKAGQLHHVPAEDKTDKSSPVVTKTAAMRVAGGVQH